MHQVPVLSLPTSALLKIRHTCASYDCRGGTWTRPACCVGCMAMMAIHRALRTGRGVVTSGGHVLGALCQKLQSGVHLSSHLPHQPWAVCHGLQLLMDSPAPRTSLSRNVQERPQAHSSSGLLWAISHRPQLPMHRPALITTTIRSGRRDRERSAIEAQVACSSALYQCTHDVVAGIQMKRTRAKSIPPHASRNDNDMKVS